jgi:hypothetical protein
MMVVQDEVVKGAEVAGRLATFTFDDVAGSKVRGLLAALGYSGGPADPSAKSALREAAEQFAYRWNARKDIRFERVFARRVSDVRVELISERIADGGGGAAEREVVAVASQDDVTGRDDVCAVWRDVFEHYCSHITSSVIGQWADQFVVKQFAALPMQARGHSVYVTAKHARGFDAWLAGMAKICRAQTMVFATMDTDPASLASIIAALRADVEKTVAKEREKLSAEKLTARGRDSAIDRLRACRDKLSAYRSLAGEQVAELDRACVEAEGELLMAVL